jgi:hypothetical protein
MKVPNSSKYLWCLLLILSVFTNGKRTNLEGRWGLSKRWGLRKEDEGEGVGSSKNK